MFVNCERGTGSWLGRTVFGGNWWVRIVREEQGAGLGGQWLVVLLGERCERGTGNWLGRTVVGGKWWVRIVR